MEVVEELEGVQRQPEQMEVLVEGEELTIRELEGQVLQIKVLMEVQQVVLMPVEVEVHPPQEQMEVEVEQVVMEEMD